MANMKLKMPYINTTPRTLIYFMAVIVGLLGSLLSGLGFLFHDGGLLAAGIVIWLFWFLLLFAAALPGTDRLLQKNMPGLRRMARNIFIFLSVLGLVEVAVLSSVNLLSIPIERTGPTGEQLLTDFKRVFLYNDSIALTQQAAEHFLAGENPYATSNVVSALNKYNFPHYVYDKITPLRTGRFANDFPYPSLEALRIFWEEVMASPDKIPPELESRLCYPAGSFLFIVPFVWLGVTDIRLAYLFFIIAALTIAVLMVRRDMKLILAGAAAISLEIWNSTAGGETGVLYFSFLLLSWITLKKNIWLSAFLMALAVTAKQLSWFFLPFYLILIFRREGWNKTLPVTGIILAVFLATNGPYIWQDPSLWASSLLAPMLDNMFPLGIGMVGLVIGGILDIQISLPFTIAEVLVEIVAIVWYARNCLRYPQTAPALAILPLFFAWRSLWPYFFYTGLTMLAGILIDEYGTQKQQAPLELAEQKAYAPTR